MNPQQTKILIVEDEILIAMQLETNLLRAGYAVCGMATNGKDALDLVKNQHPDVVMMDIRLQGALDGIDTARLISDFSSASIIFMTGYSDPKLQARAMDLNPAAFLLKPVNISQIFRYL
jgi:two-component system, response regulator PdtaR